MLKRFAAAAPIVVTVAAASFAGCAGGANNSVVPEPPPAHTQSAAQTSPTTVRYKLIDVGTFGGPSSFFIFTNRVLNDAGVATGSAEATAPDPLCFNPECLIGNTFAWRRGTLTELLPYPGDIEGGPNYVSDSGAIAGVSVRPLSAFFTFDAVVWNNGTIDRLGTFGGDFGYAAAINNEGVATGFATTPLPDALPLGNFCQNFPIGAQMRAFIWKSGVLRNLGTLGGPDSCALWINNSGDAAGLSFTGSTVNATTGIPTIEPFIWKNGHMTSLGSLGGTIGSVVQINNRSQIAGTSDLAGDVTFHPFVWTRGALTDLGTLGGNNGEANSLNDVGDVVGAADLPGSAVHYAFLWRHGVMTNLGTQDGDACSRALSVNTKGEIVGGSSDCHNFTHAFVVEPGGPMIDLNSFLPAGSQLTLTEAVEINERGEIAAQGFLPNGSARAVLLIPCGLGEGGCIAANTANTRRSTRMHFNLTSRHARYARPLDDDRYRIPVALQRSKR